MDFTKYKCPYCGQAFNDNDDVVVCPDCGTPHHRECWLKNGQCFRADKHGLNEPIEVEFKDIEAENISENTENNAQSAPYAANGFSSENNDKEPPQKIVEDIMSRLHNNGQEEVLIENHKLSLFAAAIGKNQDYYLPRFMLIEKVKKAFSWNIAGFFVPLAWALYRKMYKLAALIFALYMIVFGITGAPLITNEEYLAASQACMEEDPQYYVNILAYQSGSADVTLTAKQAELYEIMENIEIPTYLSIISYVVTLGVRIAMGIFGTFLYFKKLSKSISKSKEKASISNMPEDALKMYLYKKFGTLPIIICAIIGFFEWRLF